MTKTNTKAAAAAQTLGAPAPEAKPEPPANAFLVLLAETAGGDLVGEASEEMRKLVKALSERAGRGKLTLTLNLASTGNGQIGYDYDVASKIPKAKSKLTIRYSTEDGGLSKTDPAQRELPFAVHDGAMNDRPRVRDVEI